MRIATRNIGWWFILWEDHKTYDKEDLDYFSEQLKKINPDILFLQEVHSSEKGSQVKTISESIWKEFSCVLQLDESHLVEWEKLSLATISSYPLVEIKKHILTNPKLSWNINWKDVVSHNKWFLECKVDIWWRIVRLLCWHMVPFRKFWEDFMDDKFRWIRQLIEKIATDWDLPIILWADMNYNENIESLLPLIFSKWFKSVLGDSITTPKWRKYDKIIISKDFGCSDSWVIQWNADHYLCYADINFF